MPADTYADERDAHRCDKYHIPFSAFKIRTALSCVRKIRFDQALKRILDARLSSMSIGASKSDSQIKQNCKIRPITVGKRGGVEVLNGRLDIRPNSNTMISTPRDIENLVVVDVEKCHTPTSAFKSDL